MSDVAANASLLRAIVRALRAGARLVALRRVTREDFAPRPELFACLVALDFALTFVFSVAAFGLDGQLNLYEIPRTLMYVPLVLAAGLLASRIDRSADLLLVPNACAAASVIMTIITSALYIGAQHQLVPFVETYWFAFDYVVLGWSAAIVIVAAWRLLRGAALARFAAGAGAVMIVILPAFVLPQGMLWLPRMDAAGADAVSGFHSLAQESAFYAQQGLLDSHLEALEPQRPGVPDVYVLAAALYAGEDVFMKEVRMITDLLAERFDTAGRAVTLVNNPRTIDEFPVASMTSIREALRHIGETIDPQEDLVVVYLTSHGSDTHELAVDFRPLRFTTIDPERLKAAFDESGIRWKVIVISACYSGGFVDALEDEHTLVITAAAADRTSFGCGHGSDATYLAQALFGLALRKTHSFEAAFAAARKSIEAWEREKGFEPSHPQISAGAKIRAKLEQIERRLAARAAASR